MLSCPHITRFTSNLVSNTQAELTLQPCLFTTLTFLFIPTVTIFLWARSGLASITCLGY